MHKDHIKCTVAQKEAHRPPFLVLIFNQAIYVDIKNTLYKKSSIRMITGTNLLKYEWQASTPDLYRGKKINLESNDTILVPVEILARI